MYLEIVFYSCDKVIWLCLEMRFYLKCLRSRLCVILFRRLFVSFRGVEGFGMLFLGICGVLYFVLGVGLVNRVIFFLMYRECFFMLVSNVL